MPDEQADPGTPLDYPAPERIVERVRFAAARIPYDDSLPAASFSSDQTGCSQIETVSAALRAREIGAVELLTETIRRADALEPILRSLVLRFDERAMDAARRADQEIARGLDRGPLHGIPVVVKDHIDVEGAVTAAGSRILRDNVAARDAEVVARLRRGGAVIYGKANTHELAFGAATPPTRNPWDTTRIPGGSSGGSGAAVAGGIVPFALGTDSGASIREPSALCGIVGLKPTFGRVSCRGVLPFAPSLDTVGPMATSARDCALLLAAIEDPQPPDAARSTGLPARLGVVRELVEPLQDDVAGCWSALLDRLAGAGSELVEVSIGDVDELMAALLVIVGSEAFAFQREWVAASPELYSADVLAQVEMGAAYRAVDYVDALRIRRHFSARVSRLLRDVDLLATPAQLIVAPRVDDERAEFPGGRSLPLVPTLLRPLAPFAFSGHPAVSIPIGRGAATRLPVGAQLIGAHGSDHALLAGADAVLSLCDWRFSPPALDLALRA